MKKISANYLLAGLLLTSAQQGLADSPHHFSQYIEDPELAAAVGFRTIYPTCESHDHKPAVCLLGNLKIQHTNVKKRLSRASCNNSTWSAYGNQITVTKGCRAIFEVVTNLNVDPISVNCSSNNKKYKECRLPLSIKGAWLIKRHSKSLCQQNKDWGAYDNILWVKNGCRATFQAF
ncbi:DUF3011 domain-containing protein [Spartinivicinus poritis]|uniref:DUF3011 domain-containing protein n=1 Tax=Spartinivicinus poritis TaxID=2994640 RepID=A0ABT5U840_9GAMM|nr:DUF3011 domain-containing protein [Spartinivicinus sp. A2-2]MDE1462544.1 DUF3011 domain-containing protein [Spartinivicinus sp. A2-2]